MRKLVGLCCLLFAVLLVAAAAAETEGTSDFTESTEDPAPRNALSRLRADSSS